MKRLGERFLGATLWYVPFYRDEAMKHPWPTWLNRFIHPLPFLAVLILLITAARQPLQDVQWIVIGLYLLYLLPYIIISYYDRYAMPLVGAKVVLVVWGIERLQSWRRIRAQRSEVRSKVSEASTTGLTSDF